MRAVPSRPHLLVGGLPRRVHPSVAHLLPLADLTRGRGHLGRETEREREREGVYTGRGVGFKGKRDRKRETNFKIADMSQGLRYTSSTEQGWEHMLHGVD